MEQIEIELTGNDFPITLYIDVLQHDLARKWLAALNTVIQRGLHLEKNYCWFGFPTSRRTPEYICTQINRAIHAINSADLGYTIADFFSPANTIAADGDIEHSHMNALHRYFEDLQGVSGAMSEYYTRADAETRWHIRQLNLLCHELESLVLSIRKAREAPEWQRPSQLMCWLNSPRFDLEESDYDQFGIDTINRSMGGVYLGVNKAVGKHHWEVFNDEGRDSRISELVTSSLRSQTQAAGDFDIEWARDPGAYHWQVRKLAEFREWLEANGFDPEDRSLTIGHPKVAQVDLARSFGTCDYQAIWAQLNTHLNVHKIRTSSAEATYNYCWSDPDYQALQIKELK